MIAIIRAVALAAAMLLPLSAPATTPGNASCDRSALIVPEIGGSPDRPKASGLLMGRAAESFLAALAEVTGLPRGRAEAVILVIWSSGFVGVNTVGSECAATLISRRLFERVRKLMAAESV